MKIWRDISNFSAKNSVVTIGSFDGVHLGHQYVIKQLNDAAKKSDGESVVFTFSPHPVEVLFPERDIVLLTTLDEKLSLFEKKRVDNVVLFPFSKEFSQKTYKEFVKDVLIDNLKMKWLLLGYDNAIGKNREGGFSELLELSSQLGFKLTKQDKFYFKGGDISSTSIRHLLANGNLPEAAELLGYYYTLFGEVVHGNKLGSKLGFPTANIELEKNKFIPENGVYAIFVEYSGNLFKGMMNIGTRPTVSENTEKAVVEAHIFDFDDNLYGKFIKIQLVKKLRNEHKFNGIDALKTQLEKDKSVAISVLEKAVL